MFKLPDGVVTDANALTYGVWKYVIIGHESRPELMTVRFFPSTVEHARVVDSSVELVAGAGFLMITGGAEIVKGDPVSPATFILNSADSGSLDIKGDVAVDAAKLSLMTGMVDVGTPVAKTTKGLGCRATACVDYDEAVAIATVIGKPLFVLDKCLAGEAMLVPSTGVKLAYQTYRRGWMLYGYSDDGSDIVETLRSIVASGRVKFTRN